MTQRRSPHPMVIFLAVAFVALVLVVWLGLRGKHDPGAVQAHADFERILSALEAYRSAHGSLPEEGDLSFLVPKYLPAEPTDFWGHPYVYSSDGQRPFIQSLGQDGLRGGNGPNQDHTIHDGHSVLGSR
ncbi:type II secretion system protein GspG [Archangium minus]